MSVQAITSALAVQGVTQAEKLLLIVLANYADEKMQCWPSHSRIATEMCASQRNVLRLFAALEVKGYLVRKPRYVKKLRTSDLITLRLGGDTMSQRGDSVSRKVGTPCQGGGDSVSQEPSLNLKEEPSERDAPLLPFERPASRTLEDRRVMKKQLADLAAEIGSRKRG